jgi:hypothetical protein
MNTQEKLEKLYSWSDVKKDWISGRFELTDWTKRIATHWFDGDELVSQQFWNFGANVDGSIYSFWLYDNRSLDEAPIVYLASDGADGSIVLANSFDEFLFLLAIGYVDIGTCWWGADDVDWDNPVLFELRKWINDELAVVIPDDDDDLIKTGVKIVEEARAKHPSLQEFIETWQAQHFQTA